MRFSRPRTRRRSLGSSARSKESCRRQPASAPKRTQRISRSLMTCAISLALFLSSHLHSTPFIAIGFARFHKLRDRGPSLASLPQVWNDEDFHYCVGGV